MKDWSQKESAALKQLDEALRALPNSVLLYTTDGEISACKKGVSSYETMASLGG